MLPSPNGSAIAFAAVSGGLPVVAACLRNATAAVRLLRDVDRVGLVPAGERWGDGSLRPAYEDLVGAGAVVGGLVAPATGAVPDAAAAVAASVASPAAGRLPVGRRAGRARVRRGRGLSQARDVTDVVAVMKSGRFSASH